MILLDRTIYTPKHMIGSSSRLFDVLICSRIHKKIKIKLRSQFEGFIRKLK